MNMDLKNYIAKYKTLIDQGIEAEIARRLTEVGEFGAELEKVILAMQEISVGGKRLRGLLTIFGYQQAGGENEVEIVKAAVAIEIFHLGLLIQDDWMDRDFTRRGVKSVHARYDDPHVGNFVAMLAGDYTFGWAMEILAGLDFPPAKVNSAMKVWSKYFTRVGYGQTLDGLNVASVDSILKILEVKSGEYSVVMPLLVGASLGGGDRDLLEKLEKYGMEVGLVFQLRDDYLGYTKDMAKEGKKTFATMHGLEATQKEVDKHLERGLALAGDNQVMRELVEWVGKREN